MAALVLTDRSSTATTVPLSLMVLRVNDQVAGQHSSVWFFQGRREKPRASLGNGGSTLSDENHMVEKIGEGGAGWVA